MSSSGGPKRGKETGAHFGLDAAKEYEDDELQGAGSESLVPNVRLVNGTTRPETRQRLMLAFNTPLHPEILVASRVTGEGVDLHLNCRTYCITTCAGIRAHWSSERDASIGSAPRRRPPGSPSTFTFRLWPKRRTRRCTAWSWTASGGSMS